MANEVDRRPTIERFCEAYAKGAGDFGLAVAGTKPVAKAEAIRRGLG
jgi:hypothetical protein